MYNIKKISVKDNRCLASVLVLKSDTTNCTFKDYFPSITNIDSISVPKDIIVYKIQGTNYHNVIKDKNAKGFKSILIWDGEYCFTLILQINSNILENNLYTLEQNSKKNIKIGYKYKPNNVTVLWQNIELSPNFIKIKDSTINITIPTNIKNNMALRAIKRSYIRIYSNNGDTLYNPLLIPLDNGEILMSAKDLTIKDYEYADKIDNDIINKLENDGRSPIPFIYGEKVLIKDIDSIISYARNYMGEYYVVEINKKTGNKNFIKNNREL